MAFITDKQTITDLNIFGKRDRNSIFGIFNNTRTRGGAKLLEDILLYPLTSEVEINRRSDKIKFFFETKTAFPFQSELFDTLEHYLANNDNRSRLAVENNTLQRKIKGAIGADTDYEQLHKGVIASINIVDSASNFVAKIIGENRPYHCEEIDAIQALLAEGDFASLLKEKNRKKLSYETTAQLDKRVRFTLREKLLTLLHNIYKLDVYIAAAQIIEKHKFTFAQALPKESQTLAIEKMFHPAVPNAVANSLTVNETNNVIFLTGANMAGKSTFMKTLGSLLFLAHTGLPVPAESMRFSVLDGIFTTINLPDNLGMGYSHFYAEVLRVKKVASELQRSKKLLVIFDELFRGTNVKDAHDATVAITKSFAQKPECLFVISTHIVEAGELLRPICNNINFLYFPTTMQGNKPQYPYTLTPGITSDRHGMLIIRNEKLLEILEEENNTTLPDNGFTVDKQTIEDLNLLGEFRPNSIFNIFNHTHTRGGKKLLEAMFQKPMTDDVEINNRSAIIAFFFNKKQTFPVNETLFKQVEHYMSIAPESNRLLAFGNTFSRKLLKMLGSDKRHDTIKEGFFACVEFLGKMRQFVKELAESDGMPACYRQTVADLEAFFADKRMAWVFDEKSMREKSLFKLMSRDYYLRGTKNREMRELIDQLYHFDLYLTVSEIARKKGFAFAKALPKNSATNTIHITEMWHPALANAVRNSINMDERENSIFLTGANMAGKSTLMKSFGVAIYLAHIGFPVAAEAMEFSPQDGLYTSINVSDNLNMGYSHYYAEVLRVKEVAQEVAKGKKIVVVFDELFKGTNVKDAYDATIALTQAFVKRENCLFVVSTHIVEAGDKLMEQLKKMRFVFLPTVMQNNTPTYPYRLQNGITDDRHGMIIIQNEGILEMLGA